MDMDHPGSILLINFSPFILIVTLVILAIRKQYTRATSSSIMPLLPPGPRKLPIIGNMHELVGVLPHHALRDMAEKYGPLIHLKLGEIPTIVVSSPEVAKEVMKTQDAIFSDRPYFITSRIMSYDNKSMIFSPYGDYWRQIRKLFIQEMLSTKRIQSFRSIREEEVTHLVRFLNEKLEQPVNFSKMIFAWTYSVSGRAAFGKKVKQQDKFTALMEESMKISSGFDIGDMFPSVKLLSRASGLRPTLQNLHKQTDEILQGIIDDHIDEHRNANLSQKEAEEDFVDVLLKVRTTGDLHIPLTDEHIKAIILDLYSAASETSSITVEWAMSEMLKNPSIMKQVQKEVRQVLSNKGRLDETTCLEELHYLRAVIKETLRLHPPAPLLVPRENCETCELAGYEIPAKTKVLVNAYAIGRDPRYWIDAERFKPERFLDTKTDYKGADFEYIPFGAGRRMCPGAGMAMVNIVVPLSQLLCHFDWLLPDGKKGVELDMSESSGFTVRRKSELVLIPTPYHPIPGTTS